MTRHLLFPSLVLWFYLSTIPSRTLAEPKTDATHLRPFFDEHKSTSIYGQGIHEKRKRGGRNYLVKRCSASEHSRGSKTPTGSPVSSNTTFVTTGESKKWGLAWPNGDASYLANFARPKSIYLEPISAIYHIRPWIGGYPNAMGMGSGRHFQQHGGSRLRNKSSWDERDGVSLWKQYIDPLKYQGYYLISPACTNDQAGLHWMKSFVEGCTDCTIDAVAFHFYGTDPGAFVEHARTLHETYNKPIWVTEFADQNFSGSGGQASMSDIYAFQSAVIAFVENTPWIEAVFPFGVMHDLQGVDEGNSLLTANGWPTSLAYNYFG
ncbi:glycosyl hydrolase catalytic core-domain-containing protein [Butyriboletus roseoflavus]|nr:glycosyl hydrolase catalytic core-domain-containing protein [Butyriboletus roseoflavus]